MKSAIKLMAGFLSLSLAVPAFAGSSVVGGDSGTSAAPSTSETQEAVCAATSGTAAANANFKVPDFQAIVSPSDAGPRTIAHAGATLKVKPSAVKLPVGIGITPLTARDLPPLDAGMTNVTAKTKGASGYRFTPHPMQFADSVEVTLPYDPALVTEDFTAQDIYTYFYDEAGSCWRALYRVRVDEVEHVVVSLTDHFTDMINATVTVPEHPEGVNFDPNEMKGIQAADPGAKVNLIDPPGGGSSGDARLKYPLELPQGRQGIEPEVAVAYDSSKGNGWMGIGWDLAAPTITIETRWGVPRYEAASETETYLLNGEQLTPVAHRSTPLARSPEKVFHTRVEGQFAKIVRHGSAPANYTWEVTDRAGTRWLYGATAEGRLADGGGNTFVWSLQEVRDTSGNFMRYEYSRVDDAATQGGQEPGRNLYLKRIVYTGQGSTDGRYTVTFVRDRELGEALRPDKLIDARGGFKKTTTDRLRKVEIALDGARIRGYEFAYVTGAFHKTLLKSISQFDANGVLFNTHSFDYFDDIRDATGQYQAFQPLPWTTPGDSLSKDLLNLTGEQAGNASAINANEGSGGGGHLYVGVGSQPSKNNSIGLKAGFSHNDEDGVLALIDVDGDTLPDKVFRNGGGVFYRRNLSGPHGQSGFDATARPLALPGILDESSDSVTLGIEAYFGVAAQLDYVNTTTTTSQYFSDVNGDAIMDFVSGSNVLFGRIGAGGVPVYGVSGDTPVPVGAGALDPSGLFGDFAADRERLTDSFPLLDTVRRWVAPYDGVVSIQGDLRLTTPSPKGDGVRVAIQHENTELFSRQIGGQDTASYTPTGVASVAVTRGQRIYFRVQSIADGANDVVAWDPVVTYLSVPSTLDVNGLDFYRYQASRDFTLGGRSPQAKLPLTGTVHFSGNLTKLGATTDDVTVAITVDGGAVFTQTLGAGSGGTATVNFDRDVTQGQTVQWRVVADSPIDLTQIRWAPKLHYTAASGVARLFDNQGNPFIAFNPPYAVDMYPVDGLTAPQGFHHVNVDGTVNVDPSLIFDFEGQPVDGRVTFTVKKRGALLAKRFFTIEDGVVTSPGALDVAVTAGDDLFFDFSTLDPALRAYLTAQSVTAGGALVPSAFHSAAADDAFAQPYRGWGAIGYNGNRDRAGNAIVQTDLVVDDSFGDRIPDTLDPQAQRDAFAADPRINPPKVTPFLPYPQFDRWGASDHSWVTRDSASSSRMGTQSIALPQTADLQGMAVPRLSRSQQISLTGGVGFPGGSIGGSIATGTSTGEADFLDLNGDNFPDAAGANAIQYSDPFGGLGGKRGSMPDGAVRKSTNIAGNASAGSAARTITTGRGYGAPTGHVPNNAAEGGNDMPPLGVGGSLGASDSDGEFDLLDTNGDGLPDRVYADGRVALNLGYRFGAAEQWRGAGEINDGGGDNFGVNIGFNTDFYGFAGGASYSESSSGSSTSLMDMNGDGLLDRVFSGSPMRVGLNTGNGFEPPVPFFGSLSAVSGDQNAKLGGGVYFTIPICLAFVTLCIIINPGGDVSTGASRSEFGIRDLNGDGYADQLASDRDNQLTVAANRTERTNLLRSVARPLGARIDLEYTRDGNDYGQPHSRWTMTKVSVQDGHAGDGVDTQVSTYEYADGVYDRLEREFFGYGTVTERHLDGASPYRSVVREYRTDSHYTQGLVRRETSLDAAGRPFVQTEHTYELAEVGAGLADPKSTTATVFPQLVRTDRRFFEGQANPAVSTFITMGYDEFGNVVRSFDAADAGAADDTDTRVGYSASDPACVARNIVGIPNSIQVFGAGTLMRDRSSTVDCVTGDVTRVRARLANGEEAVTDLQYFGNGNLRAVIGPPNRIGQRDRLDYTYDTTVGTFVESVTDSFGFRSTSSYNLKFGLVEVTTDYNGRQVRNTYDALGRLDKVSGPYEIGGATPTIDFEYHPEAPVPYAVTRHVDREASGTGSSVRADTLDTIIFIDGLKRAVQTKKDASVNAVASMVVSGRVVYDFVGRPVQQYYPREEAKGPGNTSFTPGFDSVQPTVTTFDVLDRPVRVVLPDSTTMTTNHGFGPDRSGALRFETVSTDQKGKVKRVYRDVRELTTSVKEFNPAGGQPVIWTSYTNDPLRQTVSVTDDRNNVTRSTYDNFGRRTAVESPDAGRVQTDYDLADNQIRKITSKLAAQGLAVEYDYQFKRLAGIRYPVFTGNNVTYTYGPPGAPNGGANRIIAVTDGAGTVAREYGPLGEVTKETRTTAVQGNQIRTYTTQYRYDTWNRTLSMTYPDGEVLSYHYDSGGLVDSATGVKGSFTYNYLQRMDYDKFGQRVLQDTGNGTRTTYTYDAADRRLSNLQAKLSSGYVFQNLTYQYDDAGNVTSVANGTVVNGNDPGGPSTQTFAYDDLYRLTHAEGSYAPRAPRVNRYRYDLAYDTIHNITRKTQVNELVADNGNVQTLNKTTYDYNYAYGSGKPHAPTTIGLYTLAYDENGNMVSRDQQPRPRRQMIWDEENRLACSHENVQTHTLPQTPASCDDAGGTPNNARYFYDDQGTRVVKDDANFHVYPNRNFSTRGNAEFKHIYIGDSKLITKVVEPVQRIEDLQYYSHPDQLGSTGFITDDHGALAEHLNYFPSGETWVSEHPSQPVPQQFTGKELDQQTGLYYFGARYYDPRTQVWQTPDPALESYMDGSPNGGVFHPVNLALYAYAYNNPVRLVDPTGMSNWNRVWGGVKLVGGVVEAGAGIVAGAATSWTGIGAVAGGAVAVHGFDVAVSGARQLWSGEHTSSLTSQGLQAAGVSQGTADLIDGGISVVGTMGAGALARAGAATGEQVVNQTLQSTARSGAPAHLAAGKAAEQAHIAARGLAPNTEGVWRPTLEQMQSAAFKVIVGEGKFTAGGLPTGVKLDALATEIKHGSSALSSSYQLRLMVYRAVTRGEQLVIETQRPVNPTFRAWLERWGVQINQIP